jgi:hypothetical protein
MAGTFRSRARLTVPRALSLAVAGLGATVAVAAAVPAAAAVGTPHQTMPTRHSTSTHHRSTHLVVKGLVVGHHHRTVTVFAKTATAGATTRHNERLKVVFARSAHGKTKIRTGNHLRLVATGTAGRHVFTIHHNDGETVTPAPATLFFGTVDAVNGTLLTVSENDRDNGRHHDCHGHNGKGNGDGNDSLAPAHHSPGGSGEGEGDGNQITIDDSAATITVDGAAGTIVVGDTVAVLGEASEDTVVASAIYAFTQPPGFIRGNIQQIDGDNVTLSEHGNPVTISLTGVPLALNGDVGATTSELAVGDKLLVIGSIDSESGQITPDAAFAFNHDDGHPCGDNHGHGHHGHHGGEGGDG